MRARVLAISIMLERKRSMPQASQCSETQRVSPVHRRLNSTGAGSICQMLTPPARRATSSRSVLMRRKVRKTLSMQEMGMTSMRKRGVM